jgi:hypothetical protein
VCGEEHAEAAGEPVAFVVAESCVAAPAVFDGECEGWPGVEGQRDEEFEVRGDFGWCGSVEGGLEEHWAGLVRERHDGRETSALPACAICFVV